MTEHVQACVDAVRAAGWTGRAAQRLVIDPRAATKQGFNALLQEAAEIKSLAEMATPQLAAAGYSDIDQWTDEVVAKGESIKTFRNDILIALAEADVHTDNIPPARSNGDPYAARRKQESDQIGQLVGQQQMYDYVEALKSKARVKINVQPAELGANNDAE